MSRIPEAMLQEAQRLLSEKFSARAERIEFENDDDKSDWIQGKIQAGITDLYMQGGIDLIDLFIRSDGTIDTLDNGPYYNYSDDEDDDDVGFDEDYDSDDVGFDESDIEQEMAVLRLNETN